MRPGAIDRTNAATRRARARVSVRVGRLPGLNAATTNTTSANGARFGRIRTATDAINAEEAVLRGVARDARSSAASQHAAVGTSLMGWTTW